MPKWSNLIWHPGFLQKLDRMTNQTNHTLMPLISENRILPMDAQEIKRALCMYVVRIDHDLLATEANQVTSQ